jgi:predicted ATPase
MHIKIQHTGIIQRANVKLSGLNVIGGDNDTGKSTVGKLIFAIVKAVSRYEDLEDNVIENVGLEDLIYLIGKLLLQSKQAKESNEANTLPNIDVDEQLAIFFNEFNEEIQPFISSNGRSVDGMKFHEFLEQRFNNVKAIHSKSPNSVLAIYIIKMIESIKTATLANESKSDKIFRALKKAIVSEFHGEISPKNQNKISQIAITENEKPVLAFSIEKDEIKNLTTTEKLLFDDVTFIETPMIMQMSDLIRNATTILDLYDLDKSERLNNFSKPKVPLHTKDLMTKLENAHYFANPMLPKGDPKIVAIQQKITEIINGEFVFDPKDKEFAFAKKTDKKNSANIKAVNTASGVKSFGLIQMLLQTGILDERSLVVIDEPETHLHPKWQLEYAKILIELVKSDISVLVTSHSPYFIQALKVYSERENLKDKTNFYLSERNEKTGFVTINNVTKDLNQLFTKLAAPLKDLL